LLLPFAAGGNDAMPQKEALAELRANFSWDPLIRIGILEKGIHRLVFRASDVPPASQDDLPAQLSAFDGAQLVRAPTPYWDGKELKFPKAFVSAASAAFSQAVEVDRSRFRIAAVIVDPGHGGRDTGAVATHLINGKRRNLVEKDLVLTIAADLRSRLAKTYPDKRILMTRTGDTYPSLDQRVGIANSVDLSDNEAIVFVSIHANASFNKTARGYEVWYLSPEYRRNVLDAEKYQDSADVLPILNAMMEEEFTTESIMIARKIMDGFDRLVGRTSPSRGIKAEEWFVVRNARMPSVLVEIGFITNPQDAALLSDDAYLRKLSEAIYSGIVEFVTTFERTGGFTAVR
jgi:N-acetylmuramoyl-L-alanine amidase